MSNFHTKLQERLAELKLTDQARMTEKITARQREQLLARTPESIAAAHAKLVTFNTIRANQELVAKRLEVCASCTYYKNKKCLATDLWPSIFAVIPMAICPEGKW